MKMGVRRDDRKIDRLEREEYKERREKEKIQSGSIIELPLLGPTIYSTRGGRWREGRRAVAVTKPGHPSPSREYLGPKPYLVRNDRVSLSENSPRNRRTKSNFLSRAGQRVILHGGGSAGDSHGGGSDRCV